MICCRQVLTFALVSQKIQPAFKSEPLSTKTPQLLRKFLQKSSNLALYNRSKHATGCQAKPGQLYPRITLIKALVSCRFPTPRLYGKQNQGLGLGSESGPGSPVPRNTTSVWEWVSRFAFRPILTPDLLLSPFFVVICKYQDWNIQNYSIRDLKCQLILCLFVRAWSTSIFWHFQLADIQSLKKNCTGLYFSQYFWFWLRIHQQSKRVQADVLNL